MKNKAIFYTFVSYKPQYGDYVYQHGKFKEKQNVENLPSQGWLMSFFPFTHLYKKLQNVTLGS